MAYYGDILIRARPNLHKEAIEILQRVANKGGRIIDMGSGQFWGSLRLVCSPVSAEGSER